MSKQALDILTKQAKFEAQYKPYANLEKEGQDIQDQEKRLQAERLKKDMQVNFRNVLRVFLKNGQDFEILKQLRPTTSINNDITMVYQSLHFYRMIMQKKMATAADQQQSHIKQMDQLREKIKSLQKTKLTATQQLQKLKMDRAKHAEQKKEEIQKLKSQIQQIKAKKKADLDKAKSDGDKMKDQFRKEQMSLQQKLKGEIQNLQNQLKQTKQANYKQQTTLKSQKNSREQHLKQVISTNQKIQTYDQEMFNMQKDREKLTIEAKKIKDQLMNLKKHFKEVLAQRQRQQELIKEHQKRRAEYQLNQRKKHQAARRIQQCFKMYKGAKKKKKKRR